MMGFDDPFYGYSLVVRSIVYVIVPLFTAWQFVRLRRALHIFQLEGYKRARFLDWCRKQRALFLKPLRVAKKPLVMTGRAWRILIAATLLSVALVLLPAGAAHLAAGAPVDLIAWATGSVLAFFGIPALLVSADVLLAPVQGAVNKRYRGAARRKLERVAPVIVGVTGSFGKTSTKFAIRDVAGSPGRAFATPGSFNTPMGVTRAINEGLTDDHDLMVVEMGAYGRGEIAELCAFVRPTIGVLTGIGPVHLERFGSMDEIRAAKYEVVESLPTDGVAIMNVDDAEVRSLADKTTHVRVVRYGIEPEGRPEVGATEHSYGPNGTSMRIVDADGGELRTRASLLGEHAVRHILAGVAVARHLGVALAELGPRIAALQPVEHRLQLVKARGGVTIIDDAFNSNPAGAAAAIEVLADLDETDSKRKIVVTPGMIELGELQVDENRRFGTHAATIADYLILVGRTNRDALVAGAEAATDARAQVIVVDSLAEATAKLAELKLGPGDWVLFENDLPDQYEG